MPNCNAFLFIQAHKHIKLLRPQAQGFFLKTKGAAIAPASSFTYNNVIPTEKIANFANE